MTEEGLDMETLKDKRFLIGCIVILASALIVLIWYNNHVIESCNAFYQAEITQMIESYSPINLSNPLGIR